MSSIPIGLVWAQSSDGTIGVGGVMPWHLPEDLAHFKAVTLGAPVVMGRKTWDSLPARFRPLAGRRNIVVTRQLDWTADGAEVVHSVEAALALAGAEAGAGTGAGTGTGTGAEAGAGVAAVDAVVDRSAPVHRVWVIGGAELFASVIDIADLLEVTEIDAAFDGDTAAPAIDGTWSVVAVDPDDAAAPAGAATSS
ncbi:MAG: dihydrofolate reductase, partial [Leifsonia sp.]